MFDNVKKVVFVLGIVLVCSVVTGCSGSTKLADSFDEETVKKSAEEAIGLIHSNDYEAFAEKFEEATKASITKDVFDTQIKAVVDAKGKFESFEKETIIGQTDKDTGKNYAGIIVIAKYENGKVQYTIGYNEDMKLIQFLIK